MFDCDCGQTICLYPSDISNGRKSCGCSWKKDKYAFPKKHGQSKTALYQRYCSMKQRCNNPNFREYERYGGRGIKVCKEWADSFECFTKWAYANGYDSNSSGKDCSIDRIDNNGDYCPTNCRFTTAREQQKNREKSHIVVYNDKRYSVAEFCESFGITAEWFVYNRTIKGISATDILDEWGLMRSIPSNYVESQEYAKENNVSSDTIRRWLRNGKLKGKKVNNKWYVIT